MTYKDLVLLVWLVLWVVCLCGGMWMLYPEARGTARDRWGTMALGAFVGAWLSGMLLIGALR